ncbi:MAG TPA: aminotransferase class I/II-fold pyridoxal phosphate-dependent enzyme [Thermoanaerobaculia bacterium]
MHSHPFEPFWPIQKIREEGVYFYRQAIETYHDDERVRVADHGRMILFGSYSYLALNGHPRINRAAQDAISRYGTGTHGTRLLAGTLDVHRELEAELARFKGAESAVTFTSGYAANVSTITSVVGRHDTVICDKLDHASIVDGCGLSRAKLVRFRHNDMEHLAACLADPAHPGHKLVIVDAVFSMDGDIVDLPEVSRLCRRHGAILMVDEAHSLGMLGSSGRGIEEHFGLPADTIDIKMGTLSKAVPSVGGYIAGSQRLCNFLAHQARGFIYSGALPPSAAAAALEALHVIQDEPERVARLHENVRHAASALQAIGLSYTDSATAIFPVVCGDDWAAFRLARYCQERGFYVQAIPHPVVPKGLARLRVSITAGHCKEHLDQFAAVLDQGLDELAIPKPEAPGSTPLQDDLHALLRAEGDARRGLDRVARD